MVPKNPELNGMAKRMNRKWKGLDVWFLMPSYQKPIGLRHWWSLNVVRWWCLHGGCEPEHMYLMGIWGCITSGWVLGASQNSGADWCTWRASRQNTISRWSPIKLGELIEAAKPKLVIDRRRYPLRRRRAPCRFLHRVLLVSSNTGLILTH